MDRRRRSRGQALLEFSLVIPVFLTLFMGIVDFGRVVWAQNSLASAAREGARFAIVHGGSLSNPCPVGPLNPQFGDPPGTPPGASASCPYPAPSKQAVKNAALAAAIAGGTSISATVCYGAGCSGDTDAAGATDARGTPVSVTVTSQLPLVVPSLLGFSSFTVSGSSTMLVNH
ncbi:MAG TPA: TadE family protein [Candidatus Limnocylindrales bacterium]